MTLDCPLRRLRATERRQQGCPVRKFRRSRWLRTSLATFSPVRDGDFFWSDKSFDGEKDQEVVPGPVEFEMAALRLAAATWW